jgi:hypothetical protein
VSSAKQRKSIASKKHRRKQLLLTNYPRFLKACDLHQVDCPVDNTWALELYSRQQDRITTPEKVTITPPIESTQVNMSFSPYNTRLKSPPMKPLIRAIQNGADEDYGKFK